MFILQRQTDGNPTSFHYWNIPLFHLELLSRINLVYLQDRGNPGEWEKRNHLSQLSCFWVLQDNKGNVFINCQTAWGYWYKRDIYLIAAVKDNVCKWGYIAKRWATPCYCLQKIWKLGTVKWDGYLCFSTYIMPGENIAKSCVYRSHATHSNYKDKMALQHSFVDKDSWHNEFLLVTVMPVLHYIHNERWLLLRQKKKTNSERIYCSMAGPTSWRSIEQELGEERGVRRVIILMKYRFGMVKQLATWGQNCSLSHC